MKRTTVKPRVHKGFQEKRTRNEHRNEHQTNTIRTSNEQNEQGANTMKTAKELAEIFQVTDATIRTRWLPYVLQVEPGLKVGQKYTQRCVELLQSFAGKPGTAQEWLDAQRSTPELEVDVTMGELLDNDDVPFSSGSLALYQRQESNLAAMSRLAELRSSVLTLAREVKQNEQELERAEIEELAMAKVTEELEQRNAELLKKKRITEMAAQIRQQMGV